MELEGLLVIIRDVRPLRQNHFLAYCEFSRLRLISERGVTEQLSGSLQLAILLNDGDGGLDYIVILIDFIRGILTFRDEVGEYPSFAEA